MSLSQAIQSRDIRQLGINGSHKPTHIYSTVDTGRTCAFVLDQPLQAQTAVPLFPNHWYVVALSREVKTQPVGVMLWKEAMIALYRDTKGQIHALEDRCPHRLVKLIKLGLFRNYFSLVCAVFILNLWMSVMFILTGFQHWGKILKVTVYCVL